MAPPKRNAHVDNEPPIFVNREGPKKVFEDAVFAIPADRSIIRVFHGVGGQGKTALARELFRSTSAETDPSYKLLRRAELDLHGRPLNDPDLLLVWIRNGFARAGVAFPAFDVALAQTWDAARGEQPFPTLVNAWLGKSSDALITVAPEAVQLLRETVEDEVAKIPLLGTLIKKGSKWVIDKSKRAYLERSRESLQALYRDGQLKKPYELSALLPWMLAQDLNHHLGQNPDDRFVLFIDEYERVFEEGGTGARWRENMFDRHMREVIAETSGMLAAFFTREPLPWGNDPDWHDDFVGAQYPLSGLKEADADAWLKKAHVEDADIRGAIIEGARETAQENALVYPLLLELQLEHLRALTGNGTPITPDLFHTAADTFEGRCRELVQRLLRDYGDPMQITLERLSVAGRFDRPAFEHVVTTFGTALPFDRYDRIAELSFVSSSEDGFLTLHRAVAEAIRATLEEDMRVTSTEALLKHFEARATVNSPRDVNDETIAALTEAAHLRRAIGAHGYVDWLFQFSTWVKSSARYATDEQFWRETLSFIESTLGADHPDTAASYNNVAANLDDQGRYVEAEPLYRKALEIEERVLGEDHPSTATSYNNVATNLDKQGRYEEAEPLYRKALEILERVLGQDHPNTAASTNNVASNLNAQGRYEEAEPLFRKALEIRERVLGMDHPNTAASTNNVASNLNAQGRHDEAEPLFRKALEIRERVLGMDHPDTAASYNNMASNLNAQGRHDEAEPLYRKALEIWERVLGKDHPDTATSYNNVAFNLNAQGRYEEAEPLYRKGLEIRERGLGMDHPDTAASYNNVASNLNAQGRYEEAEPLYRKALEIRERGLGVDHPDTATSYNNVAYNLDAQGRSEEAEPLYRKALEIRERGLGVDHPDTGASYNNLANNLDGQGRYEEAESLYRKALEIARRVLGEDHPHTRLYRSNLDGFLKEWAK